MQRNLSAALPQPARRSSSPAAAPRNSPNMRRMRFSRRRSPSSTRSPISASEVGANVQDVARGIGLDNRIGAKFLHAGPGYGGSCFPKDTQALIKTAQDHGAPMRIVETVAAVNDQRKRAMARKVLAALRRLGARQDHRGARPHLQAEHRRHARFAGDFDHHRAAGCRRRINAFDPEGMDQARLCPRRPHLLLRSLFLLPTRPTPSSSSPNGTNSARSTSTASSRC